MCTTANVAEGSHETTKNVNKLCAEVPMLPHLTSVFYTIMEVSCDTVLNFKHMKNLSKPYMIYIGNTIVVTFSVKAYGSDCNISSLYSYVIRVTKMYVVYSRIHMLLFSFKTQKEGTRELEVARHK